MFKAQGSFVAVILASATLLACGGSQTQPEAPSAGEPAAAPAPTPEGDKASRPELTAEACEASGGTVVGDIGDGAIHK
ncbi:MAG TPA: hypothetical protein VM686_36915, partial [Polyangiaceae bacterium]|nr:hypothetical protein [Polyangiaceae bacterium]